MIKRFSRVEGRCIERICGQERFGYSLSEAVDFYDLVHWAERGGYQGTELLFYDFCSGEVYQPLAKKRNVVYAGPIYADNFLYFLQGDYDAQRLVLYKYLPPRPPEVLTELDMAEVNLYNLKIIGHPLYIISQDAEDGLRCYYPEKFAFPLRPQEGVAFIEDGRVYLEAWAEAGWDAENNCATDKYKYYTEIIVKDFAGKTLTAEVGSLNRAPGGDWWLA